ncbi:BTB/POZ and MATH domain-containing protein 1-like isoform X1 [Carex littledalei]|uniref:BTB/POZ and MATH domain-containing protein 1-like isoform X1 n=1 Tax=Carex littledalei TaxID=544730 RepID=A0A833VI79_9POAL|nr:BTB/POZ and MATH domain-containing protein 1-like isoform X1 [Carex littledalei]
MASSFTTSVLQIKEISGTHRVKICGESLTTDCFDFGRSIQCGTFTVGKYQWAILYYPRGRVDYFNDPDKWISFYVELLSEAKDVSAFLNFSLVDQNGIASHHNKQTLSNYSTGSQNGFTDFVEKSWLKNSDFMKDDSFTIECNLKILEPSVEEVKKNSSISVPPSDMHKHLHHLLLSGEGADISFKVKGETFPAHRNIIASRSSVFRAELFGSMSESKAKCIEIQDMEPQIFKAMLQFIYTDMLLPPSDDHNDQGVDEDILAQYLIVAADRYALDRLKFICEDRLAKKISAENVVTTLVLAAQHNCQQLKEICLDYISSSKILHSFTETDVFASFVVSYPSIYKELLEKVDSNRRT